MTQTKLSSAVIVDFCGEMKDGNNVKRLSAFSEEFVNLVRGADSADLFIVLDRGFSMKNKQVSLVVDHINLTGSNPLVGPNHPSGERFPVVQGIYVTDLLAELPRTVVAGVRAGLKLSADDEKAVAELGADSASYNMVPAMLVAAHAKKKVLGLIIPEGASLPPNVVQEVCRLAEGK